MSSGVWDLSVRKDESSGMRLIRFEAKLREFVGMVDVIVFEQVTVGSGRRANFDSTKLQCKLQAIIEYLVESSPGIEHVGYNPQTIKSHALSGKEGKRDKAAMISAAKERWPEYEIEDDNQADAMWLLDLAWTEINGDGWE